MVDRAVGASVAGRVRRIGEITYVMAGIREISVRARAGPRHGSRRRRRAACRSTPGCGWRGVRPLPIRRVWPSRRRPSRAIRRHFCGACARASRSGAGAWTTPRPSRTWPAGSAGSTSIAFGSTWARTRSWRRSGEDLERGRGVELPTMEFRGEDGSVHAVTGAQPWEAYREAAIAAGAAPHGGAAAVGRGGAAPLRHHGRGRGRRGLRPPGPARAPGAVAAGGRVEGPAGADLGRGDVVAGLSGRRFRRTTHRGCRGGGWVEFRRYSLRNSSTPGTPGPPTHLPRCRRSTTPGERCGPRRASRRRSGRPGVAGAK